MDEKDQEKQKSFLRKNIQNISNNSIVEKSDYD